MSQPNVVPRVNAMVQSMERPYIDLTAAARQHTSGTAMTITILNNDFPVASSKIPYP